MAGYSSGRASRMITRWTLSALAGDFDPAVQAEPLRSSRTWSASSWSFCSVWSSAVSALAVRWAARVSRRLGFLAALSLRLVRLNQATIAPLLLVLLARAAGAAMPPTSARGPGFHAWRACALFTVVRLVHSAGSLGSFRAGAVPAGQGSAEVVGRGDVGRGAVGGAEPGGVAVRADEDGAEVRVGGAGGADGADPVGPGGGGLADGGCSCLRVGSGFWGVG